MNAAKVLLLRAIRAALWLPSAVFWLMASWRAKIDTRAEVLRQADAERRDV